LQKRYSQRKIEAFAFLHHCWKQTVFYPGTGDSPDATLDLKEREPGNSKKKKLKKKNGCPAGPPDRFDNSFLGSRYPV